MTSKSDPPSDPPAGDEVNKSRLHIRGIKEMPAEHDEDLAVIFKEMRRALDLSMEQIAGRLATSTEIIAGLESGARLALPESSELNRIVTAYAALLGLDARPILRRIEGQIDGKQALETPSAAPPAPPRPASPGSVPMPPSAQPQAAQPQAAQPQAAPRQAPRAAPGPQPATASAQPRRGAPPRETGKKKKRGRPAGIMRSVLNWMILLGLVAALAAGVRYAVMNPHLAWSAFDSLPEPIPRLMRSAWELVRPLENIDSRPQISDPDNRKSDRLR